MDSGLPIRRWEPGVHPGAVLEEGKVSLRAPRVKGFWLMCEGNTKRLPAILHMAKVQLGAGLGDCRSSVWLV